MGSLPVPSPIAGVCGPFRLARPEASCVGPKTSISYRQVPRPADLTPWAPSPHSWRRRSRYLPVARRSTVARAARRICGSADLSRPGRPWPSCGEIHFLAHPSIPRDRGARGMPSSSAFPIGPRHPDLARPQQSRSCPLPAPAVTRSDHAQHPFQYRCEGGGVQRFFDNACHPGVDPDAARDRLPAPAPGAGFRSHLQIDALAAHPGAHLSRAGQALGAGDRLARGRHPLLDRAARPAGMMGQAVSGDRLGSQRRRRSRIDRVGADPPHELLMRSSVRPASSSATAACSA